jgi:hypothetical protein
MVDMESTTAYPEESHALSDLESITARPEEPQMRHELKYRINHHQSEVLQQKLSKILEKDPNMGSNGHYNIRTLYFDDYRNTAFHEKQSGVYWRKKYRLRMYNHCDKLIKFERKEKINNLTRKKAVRITRNEAEKIISGNIGFLAYSEHRLLREFYVEARCKLMRPVVLVEYERVAFIHPVGHVRVTLDTNLCTNLGQVSFFDRDVSNITVPEVLGVILEIKYNESLPKYIRGIFNDTIPLQLATSKFELCRERDHKLAGCLLKIPRCTI